MLVDAGFRVLNSPVESVHVATEGALDLFVFRPTDLDMIRLQFYKIQMELTRLASLTLLPQKGHFTFLEWPHVF